MKRCNDNSEMDETLSRLHSIDFTKEEKQEIYTDLMRGIEQGSKKQSFLSAFKPVFLSVLSGLILLIGGYWLVTEVILEDHKKGNYNIGDVAEPVTVTDVKDVEEKIIMPTEMPNDFQFSLKYGVGALHEINTFENSYTKDLVLDGTVTTSLKFSREEMKEIYEEMKAIELLSMIQEAEYFGEDGSTRVGFPVSDYFLTVQMNGEAYKAHWSSNVYEEDIALTLAIFVNRYLHDEVIVNRKEFQQLPEATGWYQ
ncbi:hypothetical protein [Bacillus alkalicellulosilyticus]|uniref:hypothetical protein n=1 Tax=Alkalihalobacterium alkalicellulosilyticum TaxID=1912214 RepID=UPI0009972904|nr:hypothetical protein [Bacillus alkalicellulosilyticus]